MSSEGLNKVLLLGTLGADPELRMTNSGNAVLKMRIATNERVKKGDQWDDHAEWHNVVIWGKRAEGLAKVLSRGFGLHVEGKLRTRSYEDRDGNKKWSTEILADKVLIASWPRDRQPSGGGGQQQARQDYDPDDDAPF